MLIVDSCGWLEWFTNGKLAASYEKYLVDQKEILMPTMVVYEVYKILKREIGEDKALLATGYMKNSKIVSFDETIALAAADISLQGRLAMADAILIATARLNNCQVITSDIDLKDQTGVTYIPKTN